ncbi:MAG: hypothetical protein LBG52_02180, partial [Candidatus Peribacteria bacterium]|nr:hypothetical protein [Candidatus Peribacteria bacterium]
MQDSLNDDIGMAELMELDNLIKRLQQEIAEYVFQKQEDNENVARLHSIIGVSKYMAVVFYVEFANKKF